MEHEPANHQPDDFCPKLTLDIPLDGCQNIDLRESLFGLGEARNPKLGFGVSDGGVAWRQDDLLGHPPNRWKVCAAVKLKIDVVVTRSAETVTMVVE